MKRPTRDQELTIVKQWIRAAPALTEQRHKELHDRPYDWTTVDALLEIGTRFGRPRFAEGLVEMQRLFMRGAQKDNAPVTIWKE